MGSGRWALAALLCLCMVPAFADAAASRVARLTYAEGSVTVAGAAEGSAGEAAQLNMPLIEGQTVVTGDNGQAEVEFEDGSLARLTPNSALSLSRLAVEGGSSFNTQLVMGRGLAYFELRAAPRLSYTVTAGGDRIIPTENTTFRVSLDEPPASIAVLDGAAHVERGGAYSVDLSAGESFRADASAVGRYFLTQEVTSDSWDQWNESRDQMAADAASQNTGARDSFAGTQRYGWSDLDANGRWYDVAGQGRVWQPNGGDAEDFDPYGNGSWVWSGGGAGYVWASSYSWGWTPFRCGGWSYWNSFGWGWTPNAACGGFGYAGYGGYGGYGEDGRGGGRRLNVILPPLHYRDHRPPTPGRGDIHPIVSVHEGPSRGRGIVAAGGERPVRTIGGVVARPLSPTGASYTARGGSAVGSSLRRDYPVDRATHSPILGIQAGQGGERRGFVSGARQGMEQPRMQIDGGNGSTNGTASGYRNGASGGYTNGAAGGYRNGASGGYTNGAASGYTNGAGSGYTNGINAGQRPGLAPPAHQTLPPPDMRVGRSPGMDGQPRTNGMAPPRGAQGGEGQGYQRMQAPQHVGPSMQVQQAPRMSAPPPQQMSRPSMPAPSAPAAHPSAPAGPAGAASKK